MLKNLSCKEYGANLQDKVLNCDATSSAMKVFLPSGTGSIVVNKVDSSANAVTILGERNIPLQDSVLQVETATVVGTVTGAGNAVVVVTSADIDGSPITLSVPVLVDDTATIVASKISAALQDNELIGGSKTGFFTVSSSAAVITLTKVYATANDATLNVSIDNDTCTGLTTAAASANTTAGVAITVATQYAFKTFENSGYGWIKTNTSGVGETETFTNKTIDSASNTLKNVVLAYAGSITRAEMVAGKTLVAAVTGRTIKVLSVKLGVVGAFDGGAGTSFIMQDTNGTPIVILTALKAALTTGARISTEGLAIANVSEGVGMTAALTANKGIAVKADAAWDAGTNINIVLQYMYV